MHEALIELFRHRPKLAVEILTGSLGVAVPEWQQARLDSGDLTAIAPTEYRADSVVTLVSGDQPVLAIITEIQLRPDPAKRYSWPVYLATLRARLRCPVVLLVLAPSLASATWCRRPIDLGHPGWALQPLVAGPEQVPVITDVERARESPELAVLSAVTHGDHPEHDKIFHALLGGLQTLDDEHADLYADFVLASLPTAIRHHLEELMSTGTYEYQSDFARRYVAEGKVEGKVSSLLEFLAARGIDVPESSRERITTCIDIAQLETWIRRAATIDTIQDLFA
jgi:hypothetical protein